MLASKSELISALFSYLVEEFVKDWYDLFFKYLVKFQMKVSWLRIFFVGRFLTMNREGYLEYLVFWISCWFVSFEDSAYFSSKLSKFIFCQSVYNIITLLISVGSILIFLFYFIYSYLFFTFPICSRFYFLSFTLGIFYDSIKWMLFRLERSQDMSCHVS